MSKSNKPPLHTQLQMHSELRYTSSNTFVYWIKGNTGVYGITADRGDKENKKNRIWIQKHKSMFSHFNTPFSRNILYTVFKKETSQASSHQASSMWSTSGQDKKHTKQKACFFRFHAQSKKKKKKKKLRWDSVGQLLQIIQTIFYKKKIKNSSETRVLVPDEWTFYIF